MDYYMQEPTDDEDTQITIIHPVVVIGTACFCVIQELSWLFDTEERPSVRAELIVKFLVICENTEGVIQA